MKKLSTPIIASFFSCLILFVSCERYDALENTENQIVTKSSEGFNSSSYELSENIHFQSFVENNLKFAIDDIEIENYPEINYEIEYTQAEKDVFAQDLGFENANEAYEFDLQNDSDYSKFSKLAVYEEASEEVRESMIIEATQIVISGGQISLPSNFEYQTNSGPCSDRADNDRLIAYGVYAASVAGCIAAAAAVATLSFWCAGCAGVAVGVLCVGGAALILDGTLGNIRLDYQSCMNA